MGHAISSLGFDATPALAARTRRGSFTPGAGVHWGESRAFAHPETIAALDQPRRAARTRRLKALASLEIHGRPHVGRVGAGLLKAPITRADQQRLMRGSRYGFEG
jgi:hypothetical protein